MPDISLTGAQVIQLVIAILTVAMSGVVTFQLNKRHQERLFYRQKLEDLYLAATRYCASLDVVATCVRSTMNGELPIPDFLDLFKELGEKGTKEDRDCFVRTRMLIAVYFPEFQPWFQKLVNERAKIHTPLDAYLLRPDHVDFLTEEDFQLVDGVPYALCQLENELTELISEHRK